MAKPERFSPTVDEGALGSRGGRIAQFCPGALCALGVLVAASTTLPAADPLDLWTVQETGVTNSLQNIVSGNGLLVAAGYEGTIMTSLDGREWTRQESGTTQSLYTLTHGGGLFVAAGSRGALTVSEDGTNWVAVNSGTLNPLFGSAYGNGLWVVAGGSNILVSANGFQWNNRPSPILPKAFLNSIAYGAGRFVGVGAGFFAVWSTNALEWQRSESDIGNYFSIVYAGGQFVAGGGGFNNFTETGASSDGSIWKTQTFPSFISLVDLTYGNGRYLAPALLLSFPPPSGLELLFESRDGLEWTTRTLPTPTAILGLTYANSRFYGVGHFGSVLQSGDHAPAQLEALGPAGSNGLQLRITGEIGRQYRVQATSSLDSTNWQDLLIYTNPDETQTVITDPRAARFSRRFYRAISP